MASSFEIGVQHFYKRENKVKSQSISQSIKQCINQTGLLLDINYWYMIVVIPCKNQVIHVKLKCTCKCQHDRILRTNVHVPAYTVVEFSGQTVLPQRMQTAPPTPTSVGVEIYKSYIWGRGYKTIYRSQNQTQASRLVDPPEYAQQQAINKIESESEI